MEKKQRVGAMAEEVLARQARARAERTGESFEEALKAVRKTEAGQQLEELREGPHGNERAEQWQEEMSRERIEERREERQRRRGRSG
jgi:hypothetical protein